jgi:hypothetical protein
MDQRKTIMKIQMLVIWAYILRKREEGVSETANDLARQWIDEHALEFRTLFSNNQQSSSKQLFSVDSESA